jgi:hypothetical protein
MLRANWLVAATWLAWNAGGSMSTRTGIESPGPADGFSASENRPPDGAGLARIERKLTWLTVGVFGVALALLFNVAAVFGTIVEFHAGEGLLVGSASAGGVAMGFVFGWLARRAIV